MCLPATQAARAQLVDGEDRMPPLISPLPCAQLESHLVDESFIRLQRAMVRGAQASAGT